MNCISCTVVMGVEVAHQRQPTPNKDKALLVGTSEAIRVWEAVILGLDFGATMAGRLVAATASYKTM